MKTNSLHYKKTSLIVLSSLLLLVSFNAAAQQGVGDVIPGSGSKKPEKTTSEASGKSVYDVIPGSGPQKTSTPTAGSGKSVNDVIPGSGPKKTTADPPHRTKRKHHDNKTYNHPPKKNLPPGQAKNTHGGSAKDYAPGQAK
jgi:hypothetical protein